MGQFDLTNKNISDTFQNLLQKTGSLGRLYDLEGNLVDNLTIGGTLTAHSYVTSESIVSTSSGSTAFGNTVDDYHTFIGNITASGAISASGDLYASSLELNSVNATDDFFLLKSGSLTALKVNNEGVLQLGAFTSVPTAVSGGFYYNNNDNEFYLGKKDS
jgi:hypothetical protein